MTPDDENGRLALAYEKLEIAAAILQGFAFTGNPEDRERELTNVEFEVQHAKAAIHEIQQARHDHLATADVWTVLGLLVQELTSREGLHARFDGRVVARAIALHREHERQPAPRVETTVFGRSTLDVVATEGGKATVEHKT